MGQHTSQQPASNRQLKVGEVLRHALAELFLKEKRYEPGLKGVSITVSEVKVSADLKNATAFVSPLGNVEEKTFLAALNQISPQLRSHLAKKVQLRFAPQLLFRMDRSFDYAAKIDAILKDSHKGEGE